MILKPLELLFDNDEPQVIINPLINKIVDGDYLYSCMEEHPKYYPYINNQVINLNNIAECLAEPEDNLEPFGFTYMGDGIWKRK